MFCLIASKQFQKNLANFINKSRTFLRGIRPRKGFIKYPILHSKPLHQTKLWCGGKLQRILGKVRDKHPELEIILKEKLNFLQHNPNDSRLKTHKLSGKLKNCWAIWITYEHRLIFHLENKYIFLLAVGTHNEVY